MRAQGGLGAPGRGLLVKSGQLRPAILHGLREQTPGSMSSWFTLLKLEKLFAGGSCGMCEEDLYGLTVVPAVDRG